MKVLFLALPGMGHYLSTLPLAWAAKAAGHDVLLVNNGPATQQIAQTGLTVLDAAEGRDLWQEFLERAKLSFGDSLTAARRSSGDLWGPFAEAMAPEALRIGRCFGPDLVVSTLEQGAGALVAAALGKPLLEQSVRLAWGPASPRALQSRQEIAHSLDGTRKRLGIAAPLPLPLACLDLRPPCLGGEETADHWVMQPVPFNGGKVLPAWVVERPAGRRIVLTLGSVVPLLKGLGSLPSLVAQLAALDCEVVLALGDLDLTSLGVLPANVRNGGWMPLSALMPTTSAIIHHGGAASCFTPFFYGVPQLVLPSGADQPMNAEIVAKSGAGLTLLPDAATPEAVCAGVSALLQDPAFAAAAAQVRAQMQAASSPAQIIARLEGNERLKP